MNRKTLIVTLASLLAANISVAFACDYKAGETKFLEYANCRYGEDTIQVVQLPENSNWDACVYQIQAFSPEKLLAVTKERDGKELLSINDRSKIGNPCYLTKRQCDTALMAYKQ